MREILFRGKREDGGGWVYGAFCPKSCDLPFGPMVDRPSIIKLENPCSGYWADVIPKTVGQYTGLTDKNGKRIFEGDIIDIGDGEHWELRFGICGGVENVSHEVGYAGFYLSPLSRTAIHNRAYGQRNDPVYYLNACEVRIIGNIHDNPELMGGTDNGE